MGLSNAEIGVRLGLSNETVKWHVSELLDETGMGDRNELATWWRDQSARRKGKAALLPLWIRFAAVPLTALGAAALLVYSGGGHGSPTDANPLTGGSISRSEGSAGPSAPAPKKNGWLFDFDAGTVEPLPPDLWMAQWLDDHRTMIAKSSGRQVTVDLAWNVLYTFADEKGSSPLIRVYTWAGPGNTILLWRWQENTISGYDPASGWETVLLSLDDPPPGRRHDVDISPDGQLVAYTDFEDDRARIMIADLGRLERRTVTERLGRDADMQIRGWSPDGLHLAFASGLRVGCQSAGLLGQPDICQWTNVEASVISVDGEVVWKDLDPGYGFLHWFGPFRVGRLDTSISDSWLAAHGSACDTAKLPAKCIYVAGQGDTVDGIEKRFGVASAEVEVGHGTPSFFASHTPLQQGDRVHVQAPATMSVVDLRTGTAMLEDIDGHGIQCVSPDGRIAIVQELRGASSGPYSSTVPVIVARDVESGRALLEVPVAGGPHTCTSRSWTADSKRVLISSWGK
jgi:hypothetical protein